MSPTAFVYHAFHGYVRDELELGVGRFFGGGGVLFHLGLCDCLCGSLCALWSMVLDCFAMLCAQSRHTSHRRDGRATRGLLKNYKDPSEKLPAA